MKTHAWRFDKLGGPEVLNLTEHEIEPPSAGFVTVRIKAIGLNRSDLSYMAGRYLTRPEGLSCLGQEAVGELVEYGPGEKGPTATSDFTPKPGDRVALLAGRVDYKNMGVFRDQGVYPANALVPIPEALSDAEAASFWVGALTMVGAAHTVGLIPGQGSGRNVVVTAASSAMGVAALQIVKARGARGIAVTTSPGKADALRALAAEVVIAPKPEDIAPSVKALTDGKGFDVAFDPVGHANVAPLFEAAAADAHILHYGMMAGTESQMNLIALMRKDIDVHGYTIYRNLRRPERLLAVIQDAMDLGRRGVLKPIVSREFPFAEAPGALRALASNQHVGKIVVRV